MEKKANNKLDKTEELLASTIKKIVWADRRKARAALLKLAKNDLPKCVKSLVAMLNNENDEATVKASFALEGLVMEAGGFGSPVSALELGAALSKALPKAKDDYALCIVLEEIRRLGNGVPKALKPYLQREDPVFTYALMAMEALAHSIEPAKLSEMLLSIADACDDKARRKLLWGAVLRLEGCCDEGIARIDDERIQKFFGGKLGGKTQDDIMLLDEMGALMGNIDFDLIKKTLGSKSALLRGLAQRVLFNAAKMRFDASSIDGDDAVTYMYDELCELCEKYPSISMFHSLTAMVDNNPDWIGYVTAHLLFAFQNGDISLKLGIIKLIANSEHLNYGTEMLVKMIEALGDKGDSALLKANILDILAKRKDRTGAVCAMAQLNSNDPFVRDAARKAAFAMGVSDKAIDLMQA